MNKYKKAKLVVEILCITCIILSIIIGYISASQLNNPISPMENLKGLVIPWIIFPTLIVLILAYYENIFAGIGILIYEVFVIKDYFHAHPYVNKLNHLTNGDLWLTIIIPIIIAIIYIYYYIKYKENNKKSR